MKIDDTLKDLTRWRGELISIYMDCSNMGLSTAIQKTKLILQTISKERNPDKLKTNIVDKTINEISRRNEIDQGLAIFIDVKLEKVNVVDLPEIPKEETTQNEVLDLDQLMWMNQINATALVINVNNNYVDVYRYDSKLIDIFKLENNFVTSKELGRKSEALTTGTDKDQRDWQKALEEFLNQAKAQMKIQREAVEQCEMAVIFYSQWLKELIGKFETDIKRSYPNLIDVVMINKDVNDKEKIREILRIKMKETLKEKYFNDFKKAKENFSSYIESPEEIDEALDSGRIDTLYLRMETEVEDSRRNRQLADMIQKAYDRSANVIIFPGDDTQVPDAAAKLRY